MNIEGEYIVYRDQLGDVQNIKICDSEKRRSIANMLNIETAEAYRDGMLKGKATIKDKLIARIEAILTGLKSL